ncbi:MAG: endonuclease III [Methylacidiphilales bacterium]|nr:endonuclease III [Candidatus Methylacidiphilales bacterium]
MSKASKTALASCAARQIEILKKTYPDVHCELDYRTPLELLVATILSAQCTDVRVNRVTPRLFARYPSAEAYAGAEPAELEALVHSTGFYRNKAKNIRECCRILVEKYKGQVPRSMEELQALPGVGRKTANVVLSNAYGIQAGIVVDTHVGRLVRRLGLTSESDPVKVENALLPLVPQGDWGLFSHLLIWHGRRRCAARNPDCAHCELKRICPRIGVADA